MNRTETNPDHSAFYVSALDAGRYFLIACPYATHDEAKARVDAVCARATELDPRAWFMGWGTCSMPEPTARAPLGAF